MKKKSQNKQKQLLLATLSMTILLVVMVILLINGLIRLIANNQTYYKIEERSKEIEEYSKGHQDNKAIGWVRVQGTNIDYPIIYASTETPVEKLLDDFTWVVDDAKELTNRVFILGHNIRNVSSNPLIADKNHTRFEQLPSFMYLDFAEKNKYIQYTINGKDYLYKIFAVSIVNDLGLSYETDNVPKEELKEYIEFSLENSFYDFDIDVDENDNILTLATCTRFYGTTGEYTYKIDARMVRENEKIKNYSVKENKNYKEIKEIMKGGEENAKEI